MLDQEPRSAEAQERLRIGQVAEVDADCGHMDPTTEDAHWYRGGRSTAGLSGGNLGPARASSPGRLGRRFGFAAGYPHSREKEHRRASALGRRGRSEANRLWQRIARRRCGETFAVERES